MQVMEASRDASSQVSLKMSGFVFPTQTTVEVVALEVARPSSSTVVVVIPSISSD